MARGGGGLLFGRRTYEDLYEVWPKRNDGNPYTEVLNRTKKYVASRTLNDPLPWANSVLLRGDAVDAVVELKAAGGEDLGATSSTSTFSPFTRWFSAPGSDSLATPRSRSSWSKA